MSYKYGERSARVYATLHPELQLLYREILKTRDHSLIEGHRSDERQEELFLAKKTKVRAGGSKHNSIPSEACDAIPYPFHQKDWSDRDKFHLWIGYVLAVADRLHLEGKMTRRVRSGADWDKDWETSDNVFDDFPHIELI